MAEEQVSLILGVLSKVYNIEKKAIVRKLIHSLDMNSPSKANSLWNDLKRIEKEKVLMLA